MKVIKKIFYSICILIMLGCAIILICAMNPEMTDSVSAKLTALGIIDSGQSSDFDNGIAAPIIEMLPSEQEYVVPSQGGMVVPDLVKELVGYELIIGQEQQIDDDEVYQLQSTLETGSTGEELTFDTTFYPYYGMLEEDEQQVYKQIYMNALEMNTSFAPVEPILNTELKNVFEAVFNDHPELFWLESTYSCKHTLNGRCLEIILKYNMTEEELPVAKAKIESKAKEIIEKAEQYSAMETQEKIVHDALVEMVSYSKSASMSQSAYSALVEGTSVCAGYAKAFQYVMQQLGIPCYYCTGYSGENHAWNIVKLGGKYYNVDVTWDDTEPSTYEYYNKSDEAFEKTHVRISLSVNLPTCVGSADSTLVADNSDASDLSGYINPDPQKPLEWPLTPWSQEEADAAAKEKEKKENLKKAGITEDEVLENMTEYYEDCLAQMVEAGTGKKCFTNVIPKTLWPSIELAYSDRSYEDKYVKEALKKLKEENFAILLQVEDLSGGYYRLYHNISTWTEEKPIDVSDGDVSDGDSDDTDEDDDVSDGNA